MCPMKYIFLLLPLCIYIFDKIRNKCKKKKF